MFTIKLNAVSLKAARAAVEDDIVQVWLKAPNENVDLLITEVSSDDLELAVIFADGRQYFASQLESEQQELVFFCNENTYGMLASDGDNDYRAFVEDTMFRIPPTPFNYSITLMLHSDIITHDAPVYAVCNKCDDVHVLDTDDFGAMSLEGECWIKRQGPFGSSKYEAVYIAHHDYDELIAMVRNDAEASITDAVRQLGKSFTTGDIVHGHFGVGRVVDILESYDVAELTGQRTSRAGSSLLIGMMGRTMTVSNDKVHYGYPKELSC